MASCGTVTVVETFDPDNVYLECSVLDDEIKRGESAEFELTMINENEQNAELWFDILVDGDPVDSYDQSIADEVSVTLEVTIETAGEIEIGAELTDVQEYSS